MQCQHDVFIIYCVPFCLSAPSRRCRRWRLRQRVRATAANVSTTKMSRCCLQLKSVSDECSILYIARSAFKAERREALRLPVFNALHLQ
jgi:hypothetical protein